MSVVAIKLSSSEADYLRSSGFLRESQRSAIGLVGWPSSGSVEITLNGHAAEELREAFTERLAKVGFDDEYALTAEGSVLESLIDRFFIA